MGDEGNNYHESRLKPTQFLVENAELLPKGRVLDLAMGMGRNRVHLAGIGFQVKGVDVSAEAVKAALEVGTKVRAEVSSEQNHLLVPA